MLFSYDGVAVYDNIHPSVPNCAYDDYVSVAYARRLINPLGRILCLYSNMAQHVSR